MPIAEGAPLWGGNPEGRVFTRLDDGEVGLAEQHVAREQNEVGGRLKVDGPPDHLLQAAAERFEAGRDVRVFVAVRLGMQRGDVVGVVAPVPRVRVVLAAEPVGVHGGALELDVGAGLQPAPPAGDVDQDPENPRAQHRASFEARQCAQYAHPRFLHDLLGGGVGAHVCARHPQHRR